MSKNVAVFVDVANIFYAAKAAGVDIDYVTLLKNATAGRDFVRAYAYTGLDPDNDNQRQFHQFLARHDYKVVSKDIRKYGDGKVKANLDIELVVDMMKTARNLDIAVVVSGDGDFAPAIRAVQEMGVRVEVISFRGNTSSDLIEVADQFTDITQLARVDNESSRSGRRVAAEDDLSMTAVPDKLSEGAPRRRRTTRTRSPEREEGAVSAEAPRPRRRREAPLEPVDGAMVALPGERLSRAATRPPAAVPDESESDVDAGEPLAAVGEPDEVEGDGANRRRRRRRGGRGRGRGRGDRPETGEVPVAAAGDEVEEFEEDAVDYAPPRAPQPSTFGSIWDSQLGVPSTPVLAGEALDQEPDDEPEIPEYLLAERRQQRGGRVPPVRPNRGGRGRGGAYLGALDGAPLGRAGAPAGGSFAPVNRA
ncbi:MAG: NYN domain-containing protein, partial [Candidatus Limnocylindrales bacterium]